MSNRHHTYGVRLQTATTVVGQYHVTFPALWAALLCGQRKCNHPKMNLRVQKWKFCCCCWDCGDNKICTHQSLLLEVNKPKTKKQLVFSVVYVCQSISWQNRTSLLIWRIFVFNCWLCCMHLAGTQEPAFHAGAEEPFLPHGGVQEEICGSISRCGNTQRRL